MVTQATQYGTRTALTITLASLANNAYRQATTLNFSGLSPVPVDIMIEGILDTGSSPTAGADLYVYLSAYDGTTSVKPGNLGASDAAVTPNYTGNWANPVIIPVTGTSNIQYGFSIPSVLAALNAQSLPPQLDVIVLNASGVALNATAGNHGIWYTPINFTFT